MKNHLADIAAFLRLKRIALVGVSRQERDFSRVLWKDLRERGYDVVPVNPQAEEIDGQRCFERIGAVQPPAEGALIMTPHDRMAAVMRECLQAGVRNIWLYKGAVGSMDAEAVASARAEGALVVAGECPFMFLPDASWYHGVHAFVCKLCGVYPEAG